VGELTAEAVDEAVDVAQVAIHVTAVSRDGAVAGLSLAVGRHDVFEGVGLAVLAPVLADAVMEGIDVFLHVLVGGVDPVVGIVVIVASVGAGVGVAGIADLLDEGVGLAFEIADNGSHAGAASMGGEWKESNPDEGQK